MRLVKPSFEIIEQKPGMQGLYEQIELAARNCYKSEGLIKYDEEGNSTTAKEFVDKVVNIYKHQSVAEHGTVYLQIPIKGDIIRSKYGKNPYSIVNYHTLGYNDHLLDITTNYRVLLENNWLDDLKYMCEPTEYHAKRVTVKYVADIHFYKDATRHRVFSWAIESTRYCNYLASRFGMSVSFMMPTWIKAEDIPDLEEDCKIMESIYFKWINKGYQAQHAAYFLPQGTKAEVIMTGFISDWKHFFELRDNENAHPDMVALAKPLHEEFIKRNYGN